MTRAALIMIALLAAAPARAMDYAEWASNLKTDAGRAAIRVWLDGFGTAIGNYEVHQALDKRSRRFCLPQGVRFSPELLAGTVDKLIEQQPHLAKPETPVAALIWTGLATSFPCAGSRGKPM